MREVGGIPITSTADSGTSCGAWGRAHGGCDDPNPQRFSAVCMRDLVRDGDRARGSKAAHL